ncbi:hypothetical protein [Paraglaciecola sp. L3A3]|uniref:hypothetical protein n=1 Tax=Paraglaciecola sp. L3A3 TaxID=2686358 RepID=UPI00131C83B0|nr:hypothetical protein [Paraglaciecola sp. L3A3]
METLFDNDVLKVTIQSTSSKIVVFCFTGVGHAMGSIDVQKEEFYRISQSATTIFITDKQRSWGNNINFDEIKLILEPHIKEKQLYALGNSMGGYLAVVASKYFLFNSVVAFVPQYSVSKRIIPTEDRWDKYINEIQEWKIESLEGCFADNINYYIFGDFSKKERVQLELFQRQENIHKIIIKNTGWNHQVAKKLRELGSLYDCILSCFELKSTDYIKAIIESSSLEVIEFVPD